MKTLPKRLFVIGTDTDSGKSVITATLLYKMQIQEISAIGIKPISSGAQIINNEIFQEDIALLNQYSSIVDADNLSPWCYEPAIAPHIAAKLAKLPITCNAVLDYLKKIDNKYPNTHIIAEGAGGINIPINDNEFFTDILKQINWPVIFVIGLKLGALNHSFLTYKALQQDNIKICGVIAKQVAPMQNVNENIATLKQHIKAPWLGFIPWFEEQQTIETYSQYLEV